MQDSAVFTAAKRESSIPRYGDLEFCLENPHALRPTEDVSLVSQRWPLRRRAEEEFFGRSDARST